MQRCMLSGCRRPGVPQSGRGPHTGVGKEEAREQRPAHGTAPLCTDKDSQNSREQTVTQGNWPPTTLSYVSCPSPLASGNLDISVPGEPAPIATRKALIPVMPRCEPFQVRQTFTSMDWEALLPF